MKDAVAALFEQALDQLIADNIINSVDRRPVQIENTRDPAHGDLGDQCRHDACQSGSK